MLLILELPPCQYPELHNTRVCDAFVGQLVKFSAGDVGTKEPTHVSLSVKFDRVTTTAVRSSDDATDEERGWFRALFATLLRNLLIDKEHLLLFAVDHSLLAAAQVFQKVLANQT